MNQPLSEQLRRMQKLAGIINEYAEEQPDIESTSQNNFIYIDSTSEVPKVGVPMDKEKFKQDGVSTLSWDNIVVIRASGESPTIQDGLMKLHTPKALKTLGWSADYIADLKKRWEASGKYDSWEDYQKKYNQYQGNRWTKHFTLNHIVASNNGGDWSGKDFVYLIPGKEIITLNGKPASLYAVDTWWSKSIILPKNTVVLYAPQAENKIKQMSIQFNTQLNGEHLKYPIYFLKGNSQQEVDNAISAMGYSTVEGGDTYSRTANLDHELTDFAKDKKVAGLGLHANTIFSNLESNTVNVSMFFDQLDTVKKSIGNDEEANRWYESNKRVFTTALDNILQPKLQIAIQGDYSSLLEELGIIKEKIENYQVFKNLKTDILKVIKRLNLQQLKSDRHFAVLSGYSSFEDLEKDLLVFEQVNMDPRRLQQKVDEVLKKYRKR